MNPELMGSSLAGNKDFVAMTENLIDQCGGKEAFLDENGNPDFMKMFTILSTNEDYCKTVMGVVEEVDKDDTPQEVIGLRKEGTEEGTWNGAFVGVIYKYKCIGAVFEDGKDFVKRRDLQE